MGVDKPRRCRYTRANAILSLELLSIGIAEITWRIELVASPTVGGVMTRHYANWLMQEVICLHQRRSRLCGRIDGYGLAGAWASGSR
jgi:hypothetical protein